MKAPTLTLLTIPPPPPCKSDIKNDLNEINEQMKSNDSISADTIKFFLLFKEIFIFYVF